MSMKRTVIGLAVTALVSFPALAGVPKDLPYPTGDLTADALADQVYYVNHFYAFENYGISEKDDRITVLLMRPAGQRPHEITLERYLNNEYEDGVIKAKDIAIFRSGKLRGTGMLIVDYVDDDKSQSYSIWLPALRKIRRFAQPAHDDAWGGSDFTFGDVTLRKPMHETHELLGTETFDACLGAMPDVDSRYLEEIPQASCDHKGKEVYKLKSTTKFENWWYDDRISYVDTETFADYRTEYFKDGVLVKVIDRDWASMGMEDPRAQSWKYWYGKTLKTGHETWAVIPQEVVVVDSDERDEDFWTERTLRRIRR
jgi:hypothetical protein